MNDYLVIAVSISLLIAVLASKISTRLGVPALLIFLVLGMLAGSDGFGGIYFDDQSLAQFIGVIALILILFSGGLDTDWKQVRPVMKEGVILSTIGVLITAILIGLFCSALLGISMLEGMLLGSIISSTDAAAVFSILRSKGVSLKGKLKPLLELESGSNDPMAVFLTVGMIQLINQPDLGWFSLLLFFLRQMVLGALIGYLMGRIAVIIINRLRLGYEGLYPVLTLALLFFVYGVTNAIGSSGFLAVYLAGMVMGNNDFIHKNSLKRFHDGLAWLMQITMFLTLGLLVFPSRLVPIIGVGFAVAIFLMVIARPVSVFIGLTVGKMNWREKLFISWVGLRGAAPIILATFPWLAGVPQAEMIFNIVFFVVLTSVLLQGTSIPLIAKWLRLDTPAVPERVFPIEFSPIRGMKSELVEMPVPAGSFLDGKAIVELNLPSDFLVILIARDDEFLLPSGGTTLKADDTLLVISDKQSYSKVVKKLEKYLSEIPGDNNIDPGHQSGR